MFFVDIDYSKRPQKLKLLLAKPNKTVTSNIHEKFKESVSLKLGNIHELNFSIPHYIQDEDTFELVKNKHVELIKEKMLIKALIGVQEEWFVVDEITEDGDDTDIFNVKAFSLGYELSHKRIGVIEEDSISCRDLLESLLDGTVWSLYSIDGSIEPLIRSFSASGTNALDCIIQAGETFGALIEWDTVNRRISFNKIDTGTFKGLTVDYGKLMQSISRTRRTDELVTRLYVYGNEDLSIHSVNPTGMPYIEDFSFFMYPFSRDENKKTIKGSDFMSDELCHAILDHQDLVKEVTPEIKSLIGQRTTKENNFVAEQTKLTQYQLDMENILNRLDVAKSLEDTVLIAQIESEKTAKQTQINSQTTVVNNLETEIDNLTTQINDLQDSILVDSVFTTQLLDELKLYIIEKEWRDDRYIDVQELFDDALEKFIELREPKVVLNINIVNLLEIVEEQYYWDKLVLGDLIKIKYPQMDIEYMAKIVEIDYQFDSGDISITIANTEKLADEMEQLKKILYESQSASTLLTNNKHKWSKVSIIEDEVQTLLNSEWDANKKKITAGVNNKIEIGNRGIIVQNPDNPNEVVIIQSGIIALSMDGGVTWKTAIKPDGVVAERLIGNVVIGRNLMMTNSSGKFTFDENGVTIDGASLTITGGLPKEQVNLPDGILDSNTDYNGVRIDGVNGLVVTSSKNVSTFNASKGIEIKRKSDNKVLFSVDANGDISLTGSVTGNITMNGGSISWANVTKPTYTASDVGALSSGSPQLTYIDSSGVYTGTVSANQIYGGTITGVTFKTSNNSKQVVITNDELTSKGTYGELTLKGGGLWISDGNLSTGQLLEMYSNAIYFQNNGGATGGSNIVYSSGNDTLTISNGGGKIAFTGSILDFTGVPQITGMNVTAKFG